MNSILIYFLKVNLALTLFYLFYKLFFSGDTFFKIRRIYLLVVVFLSFVHPLISINDWISRQPQVLNVLDSYAALHEITVTPGDNSFDAGDVLLVFYVAVALVLFFNVLVQFFAILKIQSKGQSDKIDEIPVIVVKDKLAPFSFFNKIYINPILHTASEITQILAHEQTHIRQKHSFDVVSSEFLCALFWINPFVWLLKNEIRQNLEFLADNGALKSGTDRKSYQYHLLRLTYQNPGYNLTNKFNVLPLKKRIIMMNQKESRKIAGLKYLLLLPLTFSLVLISSAETLIGTVKNMNHESEIALEPKVVTNTESSQSASSMSNKVEAPVSPVTEEKQQDVIFQVVETMPAYPGGDGALIKFLTDNVKYPAKAVENKIEGRVITQFVVNKDGSVTDVVVARSVDPLLDAEAVRVVSAMPKWAPGKQKGKAVRVRYTLPINFSLGEPADMSAKKPIIVIDGEIKPADFDINSIKPENISKLEVLKNEAAGVYGEQAKKQGVIIVTTKK